MKELLENPRSRPGKKKTFRFEAENDLNMSKDLFVDFLRGLGVLWTLEPEARVQRLQAPKAGLGESFWITLGPQDRPFGFL